MAVEPRPLAQVGYLDEAKLAFIMISNWKNSFTLVSMVYTIIFLRCKGLSANHVLAVLSLYRAYISSLTLWAHTMH